MIAFVVPKGMTIEIVLTEGRGIPGNDRRQRRSKLGQRSKVWDNFAQSN